MGTDIVNDYTMSRVRELLKAVGTASAALFDMRCQRDAAIAERDALKPNAAIGALIMALPVGADIGIMHDDEGVWSAVVWKNYNFLRPDGDSDNVGIQHSVLDAASAAIENAGIKVREVPNE